MKATIEQLQQFYFQAMMATWAGGGEPQAASHSESTYFLFQHTDDLLGLVFNDEFWIDGGNTAGSILIFEDRQLVWSMQYQGGQTDASVDIEPLLKAALMANYRAAIFHGGRGPKRFWLGKQSKETVPPPGALVYFHETTIRDPQGNGFVDCIGEESIYRYPNTRPEEKLFWHRLQIMLVGVPELSDDSTDQIESSITAFATSPEAPVDLRLQAMMDDTPFCDNCGHIMARHSDGFKCLNCGNTM